MNRLILTLGIAIITFSCSENEFEKKGFQVSEISEDENGEKVVGLKIDTLKLETRPRNVLLTKFSGHRLSPVYKINYNKKTKKPFTGSNSYHTKYWSNQGNDGNNWNSNFMPGYRAVYGYNFVNISHFNVENKTENKLFDKPVLIKTLYYPAFSQDTLNHEPISRNHYMVSVYDEDSNNDGFVNAKDLRRFYLFDINGNIIKPLIPKNYSVISSEYDSANDYMYVFAKIDKNQNGRIEQNEGIHIFWIDLKNPEDVGLQYKNE